MSKDAPGEVCSWRELLDSYDGDENCTGVASVTYLVEFADGDKQTFHLCEPCARRIEKDTRRDPRIARQMLMRVQRMEN